MSQKPAIEQRFVIISVDGQIDTHAPDTTGNYATMCGLDGDDPKCGQVTENKRPLLPKITCERCCAIIRLAKQYRLSELRN